MALDHVGMKQVLSESGCRTVKSVKKVMEYMLPRSKEPFYLHTENTLPQIIIMPKFIHILDALAQIGGVCAKKPYYHNADMILFPKRFNNGEKEVHYGLAFEFDNKDAVRVFIDHLVGAVNGGANR